MAFSQQEADLLRELGKARAIARRLAKASSHPADLLADYDRISANWPKENVQE